MAKRQTHSIRTLNIFLLYLIIIMLPLAIINLTQHTQIIQQASANNLITWSAFDGGGTRTGVNTQETIITSSNVGQLQKVWGATLPYKTNGTVTIVPNVQTNSGTKTLVFATTQNGTLVALDDATGQEVWSATTNGNFVQSQGTSSSPAVDPSNQFVYSYGLDGKVHKYTVGTGVEITGNGFPVTVTINTDVEKESSPLNITNNYLYVTLSGYDGDFGHYDGHGVAVNLSSGTSTVFNVECSNITVLETENSGPSNYCPHNQSGVWGRGGLVVDPLTNNVFMTTGNGLYDANTGGHEYGDSIIELSPDLTQIIDTYTPSSFSNLQSSDADLGSTAPLLLPTQNGSNTPHLIVQGGKDSTVRLINRDNLSGQNGPDHVGGELQSISGIQCDIDGQPIAWNDATNQTWVFVTTVCGNLYVYKVVTSSGHTSLQQAYTKTNAKTSPFIANGILFVANNNVVTAMNPTNGIVLWASNQASAKGSIAGIHWQSPVVVNGTVYMADENGNITAYKLPAATPTITSIPPPPTQTPTPLSPTITPTLSPTTSFLPGDINHDGKVNVIDFSILAKDWGRGPNTMPPTTLFNPGSDINGDGIVDIKDLSLMAKNWTG